MNIDEQLELRRRVESGWPKYFQSIEFKKRFIRCPNRVVAESWNWITGEWAEEKKLNLAKLMATDNYRLVSPDFVEESTGCIARKARWFRGKYHPYPSIWRMFNETNGYYYQYGKYLEPAAWDLKKMEGSNSMVEISEMEALEFMKMDRQERSSTPTWTVT